jgi:predicted 3-demethylubiquinone-9 3-methyltransferase (glyoxalase superfamily)
VQFCGAGEIKSIDKETFHFLWYDGQAGETMNFLCFDFQELKSVGKAIGRRTKRPGAAGFKLWTILSKLLQDKGTEKTKRAMQAMLQTDKIDIDQLKQAAEKGQVEC